MGLIPLAIVAFTVFRAAVGIEENIQPQVESTAITLTSPVERNLFERYGDAQALASNAAIHDTSQWYKRSEDEDVVIRTANTYVDLYDIHTAWLHDRDFSSEESFQETLRGEYLSSESVDGTHVEDLHADEDVAKIYGTDGLSLGYTAPTRRHWSRRTSHEGSAGRACDSSECPCA